VRNLATLVGNLSETFGNAGNPAEWNPKPWETWRKPPETLGNPWETPEKPKTSSRKPLETPLRQCTFTLWQFTKGERGGVGETLR